MRDKILGDGSDFGKVRVGEKLQQGTAVGGIEQEASEQVLDFLAAEEVELLDDDMRDAVVTEWQESS